MQDKTNSKSHPKSTSTLNNPAFVNVSNQSIKNTLKKQETLNFTSYPFPLELGTLMSTLSEAYKDHVLHLHHIIPLEFDSVQAVPESHAWPQSIEHEFRVPSSEQLSIPIIDFMDPNAAKLVGHACETWGAFQLTNHGVPLGLLEDVESEAQRLFSLPAQQKMKTLRSPGGATGYGIARMSPFFNKLMWHEGFTIIGSSADHAKELWPHDNEKFW